MRSSNVNVFAGNNTHLCREYVGEGIDRFRIGKYSGNHSMGFMTGYLIAGDANAAVLGVNKHLNFKSRRHENLRPSNLISESWVWRSHHPRTTNFTDRIASRIPSVRDRMIRLPKATI